MNESKKQALILQAHNCYRAAEKFGESGNLENIKGEEWGAMGDDLLIMALGVLAQNALDHGVCGSDVIDFWRREIEAQEEDENA